MMNELNSKHFKFLQNKSTKTFLVAALLSFVFGFSPLSFGAGETPGTYVSIPPFIAASASKPNVIISLDTSGSMKVPAYGQGGVNWKNGLHDNFDPSFVYYGFFNPEKYYKYDTNPAKLFFVENGDKPAVKPADSWDGNFLNWLSMRRFDVARRVLIGGKVRDRATESIGGQSWYVIEGQNEPQDHQFSKTFPTSSTYTPSTFPDGTVFKMSNGQIDPLGTDVASTNFVASSLQGTANQSMEMGIVTMDWSIGPPEDPWAEITFDNTYTTPPAVVAKTLTYNGGDPTIVRVRNVTTTGFEIRLQEWDYRDGNHTTEDIFYMVADVGNYTLDIDPGLDSGGSPLPTISLDIQAGKKLAVSKVCEISGGTYDNAETVEIEFTPDFDEQPILFTATSTFAEADAVTVRHDHIDKDDARVCLQEQESKFAVTDPHASETIDYIAIAPQSGDSFPVSGVTVDTGAEIEVGEIDNVDQSWKTHTFNTTFSSNPMFVTDMQEVEGSDPATVRVANAVWSTTQIDVQVDEEQSNDSETTHNDEDLGYVATVANGQFNIQLGIVETDLVNKSNEPIGLVQKLGASMDLGIAVFNYDHTRNPTSVYNGNGRAFDGGTFNPCYPNVALPASDRTNWDICKETYVGAPIDDLIDVIEDHPLVWATTPIAETLYNIGQYVAQGQAPSPYSNLNSNPWPHDEVRQGSPTAPNTHNGNSVPAGNVGAHPLYQVNNTWDPYYVSSLSQKVPCEKTFVLHFNDGAPYTDWDDEDSDGNPLFPIPNDISAISGYTSGNPFDDNDGLDEVAHKFRNQDLRDDLIGHQEIISYYVLAALGEDMSDIGNGPLNRLMRAAAMGGFNDINNDLEPDEKGVTDFVSYINTNGGVCPVNEWDEDGNCVPDTFYFANDGFALEAELLAAFESILKRVSAGGAASVLAGTTNGQGAIFEARFEQERATAKYSASWIGDVSATFVDSFGFLREDGDQNQTLSEGDYTKDGIITMCQDPDDAIIRVNVASAISSIPDESDILTCSSDKFNKSLGDIKRIWSAAEELSDLTDSEATSQRSYSSTAGRYIITGIDGSGSGAKDGIISSDEEQAFLASSFNASGYDRKGLLLADDATEAANIVDFTRGQSQPDNALRKRQVVNRDGDLITWRLGDIIYSSPKSISRPPENYHQIYSNNVNFATYRNFFNAYRNRRSVVFAGGNDGMLHAFNGGYFNPATLQYDEGYSTTSQYDLGSELWAYLPYNALPHLKYLADPAYGGEDGDHISLVDAEPRIFDVRIFNDATFSGGINGQSGVSHPDGWGTILVGSMRLGGGPIEVDTDADGSTDQTLRSSIFVLDITDPEKPPKLLMEYTSTDLGFTIANATPIVKNNSSGLDEWYLLLGSGPHHTTTPQAALQNGTSNQPAKLYLFDLRTMQLESDFGTAGVLTMNAPTDASDAFITGMYAVDYNNDTETDVVYLSTVNGASGSFGGKLYRLTLRDSDGTGAVDSGSYRAITTWSADILVDNTGPITAISNAGLDQVGNRWVYFGTGRFLVRLDSADNSQQSFYGVKEPRNTSGGFTWSTVDSTKLVDVSNVTVNTAGSLLLNGTPTTLNTHTTSGSSAATFSDLSSAMLITGSNANHGWKRNFGESPKTTFERNVGQAVLLGGVLLYTAYEPSSDVCKYEGTTTLYGVNFLTGTASNYNSIFGTPDTSSGPVEVVDSVSMGGGLTATINVHLGTGYNQVNNLDNNTATSYGLNTNGMIISNRFQTEGAVISGEANWRIAK